MGICFSHSSPQAVDQNSVDHQPRITTEYESLSEVNDHRLDTLIGQRNGQTIDVSTRTFEVMKQAYEVLREVGYRTFPDGSGNQEESIWASQAMSAARMLLSRQKHIDTSLFSADFVHEIKMSGGGNCLEFARISSMELFSRGNTEPVFEVSLPEMNHGFVIVGDWRDRRVGDQAVVVDAWQGLKKVHTYGERAIPISPVVKGVVPPANSLPPLTDNMRMALAAEYVSREEVASFMDRLGNPLSIDRAGSIGLIMALRESGKAWRSISSTSDLYSVYRSPDGEQSEFSATPKQYLNDYLKAGEEIDAMIPR